MALVHLSRCRRTFPHRVMLDPDRIVTSDPLLPTAAAYLDSHPDTQVTGLELADHLRISIGRAEDVLSQLHALGHVGPRHGGARIVFDPDGPTDPTPLDIP